MSNKNTARASFLRSQTAIVENTDNIQGLSSRSNNIKVVGRFRPLIEFEKAFLDGREIISFINEKTVAIGEGKDKESFTLDRIYDPNSTNQEIFDFVGKQTILDVMEGYNGTIFVYGQTGSGKTYTMLGDDIYDEDSRGIIPRAASQIFDSVQNSDEDTEFILKCSMLEIYKETLRDLLDADPKLLKIKESPRRGVYVEGLNEVCVTSEIEMLEILSLGETMRTVAATKLNKMSSRSHLIFILEVMQKYSNGAEKKGMLNLVDLAGSEKVHSTGVAGHKIEETKKINLSLSALGNVIHALISNSDHVPYRDSKLTRILQESLGGNYKTTLIVACSLSPKSEEETLNTMRFALRARAIRNKVRVNIRDAPENYIQKIEYLEAELRTAKTEITQLKGDNPRKSSPVINKKAIGRMSTISLDNTQPRKRRGSEMKAKETNTDMKVMVSLEELRNFSDEPSRIEKKNPNPFPLFEPDSLASSFNFIPEKGNSDVEVDSTSNFRESLKQKDEEIHDIKKKNHTLKKENQALTEKVHDLEEKMASMRAKQLQIEQKTHEYYDNYHKTALLINKDAAENSLLKKQNESLNNQVKRLTKALMELDIRYKNFIDSCRRFDVSTCVEFEERTDIFKKDDFPVITEVNDVDGDTSDSYDLGLSRRDISIDRKEVLISSPYAIELKRALDSNAELSKDVALFQLRNEVIQAGIINANLVRAYHGLDWKLNLVNHKYMMKRSLCKHQMENIKSLEKMLDFLHHSYRHVIKLYDQMEREAPKTHCQTEATPRTRMMRSFTNKRVTKIVNGQIINALPQDSGSFTFSGQALRSAARTLSVRPTKENPVKADETPKHYNSSFAEAESIDPSFYHTKLRAIETSFNLQQLYNEQLKKMNEEYKEELNQYKVLLSNLENDIFTSHKNEMERWKSFVDELKNNCEQELIRKQCEVVRLNEVLGEWTTRFMELQENLSTQNKPLKKEMYIEIQELVKSTMNTAIYTEPMTNINRIFGRSPLREYLNITPLPIGRRLASQGDQTP